MYYLNARYYHPLWIRFVSADELQYENTDIFSHNVYAYCGNRVTMRIDEDGYFWKDLGKRFLEAACIALTIAVVAAITIGTGGAGTLAVAMGYSYAAGMTVAGAVAVSATAVAGAELTGAVVCFANDNRPGNNKAQNEQFRSVMKELGYNKTSWQWRYVHDAVHKKNFKGGYKKLLEFAIKVINEAMGE